MKLAATLALALFLAGCNVDRPGVGSPVVIWTDRETGCQYLVAAGAGVTDWSNPGGSITPRLGPDGRPLCGPREPATPPA
ncbi:MAG: DUF6440 family protein [Hyphomonadaceae bacterium]